MRITVADTGHGMSPAVRSHIFDAFYTTKGNNGTGLGLWISHGIVEKHHGRLDVKSCARLPHTRHRHSVSSFHVISRSLIDLLHGHAQIGCGYRPCPAERELASFFCRSLFKAGMRHRSQVEMMHISAFLRWPDIAQ